MSYLLAALVFLTTLPAQAAFDHSHAAWTQILEKNLVAVSNTTKLKYSEIKKDTTDLDNYLKTVSGVSSNEYDGFSETQKLAFLFNAYNAFTVRLILNQKEIPKSIKDIKERSFSNPLGNPWKHRFFNFLGASTNLDQLEHDLARPKYDEPRLHFAFNCASVGCPSLLKEAFVAEKLEVQLDQATRNFLGDASRNRWDATKKTLLLSKIFDWYGKDFEKSKKLGPLRKFLGKHMNLPAEVAALVETTETKIEFLEYDWKLNSY